MTSRTHLEETMNGQDQQDVERCKEWVSNGSQSVSFHECGNPAKKDGLCGVHLRAIEQRAKSRKDSDAKRDESDRNRLDVEATLTRLGVEGDAQYSSITHKYTGRAVLTLAELERIVTKATQ